MIRQTQIVLAVCTLLVWAGVIVLLLNITPNGPGVSPDGVQYLDASNQMAEGRGLYAHFWARGRQPLVHFPPLYPALLAGAQLTGLDRLAAARLVSSLSLLATLFAMVWLLSAYARERFWMPIAVMAFLVLSPDLLLVHAMALSEPPFLALTLAAIIALWRAASDQRSSVVIVAGLLVAVATLTRYVGLAMTGVGVVVLFVSPTSALMSLRARAVRAAAFAAVSLLPMVAWVVRNRIVGGTAANRPLGFHPPALRDVRQAVATVYHWLIPAGWGPDVALPIVGILTVCFCVLLWDLKRDFHAGRGMFATHAIAVRDRSLAAILGLYCAGYLVFVVLSKSLGDAQIDFEPRMLLVVLLPMALIIGLLFAATSQSRRSRFAGVVVAVVALASTAQGARDWIRIVRDAGGIGYTATGWIDSPLARELAALPDAAEVYSNVPDGFFFVTGRLVNGLPRHYNPQSLTDGDQFLREMHLICAHAIERGVYIGYHQPQDDQEAFIPTLPELTNRLSAITRARLADGVLLSVPPECAP